MERSPLEQLIDLYRNPQNAGLALGSSLLQDVANAIECALGEERMQQAEKLYQVDVWQPIGETKIHTLQVRAKTGYHAKIAAIKQLNLDQLAVDRFELVLLITELDDRLLHDDPLRERHTKCIARIHQLFNGADGEGFATLQWGPRENGHDGYHVVRVHGTLDEELVLSIPPLPGALEALEAALDALAKAKQPTPL